jgi:DNA-binding transcriptional ArsR family regulator
MNDNRDAALEAEVLAQQLERFASRLRLDHASEPTTPGHPKNGRRGTGCSSLSHVELARKLYHARRERETFFPPELFGEPAWDMLLDLYVAQAERRETSVTSLTTGSGGPQSTALRWLALLEELGLMSRMPAVHDRRVIYMKLTDEGVRTMHRYLRRIGEAGAEHGNFLLRVK